ncbi:MAG: S8 family serine peptidase [Euryhalocaulis sp.]|nr:S8 family serine peptidase [Euryhalocaulis sp.]
MQKMHLFAGVASLTVLFAGQALAKPGAEDGTDRTPYYGDINPFYGDLDPFYGDINPFYGDINPFYGDISPFWGDIGPFWGDINPFYGDISAFWGDIGPFYGDLGPFWGDIGPFWGDIGPFWGDINAFWGDIGPFDGGTEADYQQVLSDLNAMLAQSEAVWGEVVEADTGLSFWNGFAQDVFAKHGIDLTDASSLEGLDAADRSAFFMDWYDGLMAFSGADRVDHWMAAANWSPALTQIQGSGDDVRIGLLDASVHGHDDLTDNLIYAGGYDSQTGGHGAGVISLLVSEHDGEGVMGIAPNADVAAYSPFDETGTAGWDDIRLGIYNLLQQKSTIINMSLGVSGWTLNQEWSGIFSDKVIKKMDRVIFVKAAGNDGIQQTVDLDWDFRNDPNLLIVGSVGPSGEISSFSNTPGEACLLDNGICHEENKLKYRFLVAPGEMILVADGEGGLVRRSGTSFAAPLVTGAIALLHDRWPWLSRYPKESAGIILQSARDLGEPGVDGVYGWGMLDIEASQSPLNFNRLYWYENVPKYKKNGELHKYKLKRRRATQIRNPSESEREAWEADGMYFYAFEYIGDTWRDFAIPLSTQLIGQTAKIRGEDERFQHYLYERMIDWMDGFSFSDVTTHTAPIARGQDWRFEMSIANRSPFEDYSESALPFQTGFSLEQPETGLALKFGYGEGAMALSGQEGFGLFSDYDVSTGGANPVLGLASGGAYAGGSYGLGEKATLSFGMTETQNDRFYVAPWSNEELPLIEGLEDYKASAINFGMDYALTGRASFGVAYTQLQENSGLLGIQGLGSLAMDKGGVTDAATFSGGYQLTDTVNLSASVTVGRTRAGSLADNVLSVADGGLTSTAFGVAAAKTGLFGESDRVRLSMAQPLQVSSGQLEYTSVQVVDRQTGEIGVVTETFDIGGQNRDYVFEALYAAPVMDGRGEISAFSQAETRSRGGTDVTVGARFGIGF